MHPASAAEAPLTPGLVFEMLQAHHRTAALKAAIDLDIFALSAMGRVTSPRSPATPRLPSAESASCAISSPLAVSSPRRTAVTATPRPAPPSSTPARLPPSPPSRSS
jgi:hypothetical protein